MPNPPVPFPLKVLRGNTGNQPIKPEPLGSQTSAALATPVFLGRAIVADLTQAPRTADSIPPEHRAAARC